MLPGLRGGTGGGDPCTESCPLSEGGEGVGAGLGELWRPVAEGEAGGGRG